MARKKGLFSQVDIKCSKKVLRAKHNDSGVYMIVAENEMGKASIEANIIIREPKDNYVA